jgi:predicted DNA-binding protein
MRTISLKLSDEMLGRLDDLSRKTGEDRSSLIRESVELFIANKHFRSAHEKLSHLCGLFKGGAKYASVSEDYRERLGRD